MHKRTEKWTLYYKVLHIILLVFTTHPKEYTSSKTSAESIDEETPRAQYMDLSESISQLHPVQKRKYMTQLLVTTAETARSLKYSSWPVGNTSWRWLDIYWYPNNQCYIEGKFIYCWLFCQFNVLLLIVSVNVINACFIVNLMKPRYCSKTRCCDSRHQLWLWVLGLHPAEDHVSQLRLQSPACSSSVGIQLRPLGNSAWIFSHGLIFCSLNPKKKINKIK